MKTVNVGVVGTSFMAAAHIKAYLTIPGARVAAICNSGRTPFNGDFSHIVGNVGDTSALKLDMTQVKAYTSLDEMLIDPSIDLIDLCVPTALHHKLSLQALKSGKHVVCEKPLARTSAQCRDIVEAAAKSKGYFMPAMVMRFWPDWVWIKNLIDSGKYGKVLAARFRRVCPPPGWSKGSYFNGNESGGALFDLHIHDTDFIQFCFGKPHAVFAIGSARFTSAIDHVVTSYQFASGIPVMAEASWYMTEGFGFNMQCTVNFERATADYDLSRGADALRFCEDGQKPVTIKNEGADGYVGELRHMIESIQNGKAPSIVTAADGLSAVQICEAAEKSIKTGMVATV